MLKRYPSLMVILAVLFSAGSTKAQNEAAAGIWQRVDQVPRNRPASELWIRPNVFRSFNLNHAALKEVLGRAPKESVQPVAISQTEISLPMPDGSLARFRIVESPVMAPELAAKFPEIKTYLGQGIDDPTASVRFDMTLAGFHAQILSLRGAVYIDPQFRGDTNLYACYYKRDYRRAAEAFQCFTPTGDGLGLSRVAPAALLRSGSNLRTYRLACATTGEYTQFHGGTVAAGMAAIVTAINRVSGVYETELAIRQVLVANNDLIVYTNPNTDPYNNDDGSKMLDQNQSNLDSVIGDSNYDIGHVFSTGGGGIAGLGVACVTGSKAWGVTGNSSPTSDSFWIDYVAHEMGHQFGANHTFNSTTDNCGGGNRNASTAYEPGSGSTIMAYAGICGSDDLQAHSDPYSHSISFDEIVSYTTTGSGSSCPVATSTGNNVPTVNAGSSYTIPKSTPFVLTASGSDPDNDPLTYCWEERDLGPATTLTTPDNGSSPLFRSFNPTSSPSRTFPQLSDILNNTATLGEMLPTTSRTMSFRVTARDNRSGGGGVNTADMQVTISSSAGPFLVTSYNNGGTFSGVQTLTWDVAGTSSSPINAANVNILLSTNGGVSFPIMLVPNTPNDGAQTVVLPNIITTSARIKVEAAGNVFFDISNTNFSIVPAIPTPLVVLDSTALSAENCTPTNNAIDPGETVTVNLALRNTGTGDTTNHVATLLPTNGVTSLSGPQTYGALVAGGAAVSRPFTFVVAGACGDTITAVLQLQDAAANLGTLNYTFGLGALTSTTGQGTNAVAVSIPANGTKGKASPYPSTISIAGITGTVSKVTVTLTGFSHTWPADVDVLLVGPTGQTVLLMSDAGGGNSVSNLTVTFDDGAASSLPDTAAITTGTYKPTNFDTTTDNFPSPAPSGTFGQTLSLFNGMNPNGTWSLFVQDDDRQDTGSIEQGWWLSITTSNATCCMSSVPTANLALGQSAAPATLNRGSNVTFTLNVTNLGPDAASNVVVTDTLPAGLSFVSASTTQGTCTNNGGVVTCALGTLTNGSKAAIAIQAAATLAGAWTNTAYSSSATLDPVGANNNATATVSVNSPPTISEIADYATDEDTPTGPIAFTIGDAETPATALTVTSSSSNTNLVPQANIVSSGSGSNRTVTITPAADQSGTSTITITVSDGLADASDAFVLTVNPVNDPPVLAAIPDYVVSEGDMLTFTNFATDAEAPPETLTFSLVNEPVGATINPTNGVFTWTPEAAPSTNVITVVVSDDGVPSLSATQGFTVIVLETNSAPGLTPIADRTVYVGSTLVITNTATDADMPTNTLTFSLDPGAPAGASINAADGVFTWTPSDADADKTYSITVRVTDDGWPNLSDAKTFRVTVVSRPRIESIVTSNNEVTVTWTAFPGGTYRLQCKTNLADADWTDVPPDVTASGPTASQTDLIGSAKRRFYRIVALP